MRMQFVNLYKDSKIPPIYRRKFDQNEIIKGMRKISFSFWVSRLYPLFIIDKKTADK